MYARRTVGDGGVGLGGAGGMNPPDQQQPRATRRLALRTLDGNQAEPTSSSTASMDQNKAAPAPRRGLADITNRSNTQAFQKPKASAVTRSAAAAANNNNTGEAPISSSMSFMPPPAVVAPIARRPAVPSAKKDTPSTLSVDEAEAMDLAMDLEEIDMSVDEGVLSTEIQSLELDCQEVSSARNKRVVLPAGVDDIDGRDEDDPLCAVEYVKDLYTYLRDKEMRPGYDPMYMAKQAEVTPSMRRILVNWLVTIHKQFKCCQETLYLTVNVLDRFLDRKSVPQRRFQLVGATAFLIASKYEDIYPPEVADLVFMTDNTYTKKQILDMECKMLTVLKFNLTVCTAHAFLIRFCKAGHLDPRMHALAAYICERSLEEIEALHFLPSMIAAAAVYLSRLNCQMRPWSPTLAHFTQYSEEALMPCLRVMSNWLKPKTRPQGQDSIIKKYSTSRLFQVSKLDLQGIV